MNSKGCVNAAKGRPGTDRGPVGIGPKWQVIRTPPSTRAMNLHPILRCPRPVGLRLRTLLWALTSLLACQVAVAQTPAFPSRNLSFIVPFTPGTTADALARLLGAKLSERWGVAVVTENRPGASGAMGAEAVSKAAATGHTLLFTATSHGTVPALRAKLPFDPIKGFEPVVLLGNSALGLVVPPSLGMKTFADWLTSARAKPGQMHYASPGNGVVQHLAMEWLMQETGARLTHVPYKGAAGAMTDLMGGHVQASIVSVHTSSQAIHSGQLQMLAVMGEERSAAFPKVPTLKELGWPNMVVDTWYGVFAPAGTPPEVVTKINTEINQLLLLPEVREALAKQGLSAIGGKPDRLAQLLSREVQRWRQVVASAHIQAD